jgi:hypothetical protein
MKLGLIKIFIDGQEDSTCQQQKYAIEGLNSSQTKIFAITGLPIKATIIKLNYSFTNHY